MKTRCFWMTAFILMISMASVSLGLAQDGPALVENQTADETVNVTAFAEEAVPEGPALVQGIWKVSMAGTEITMALNQSGDSLFGLAKFEGTGPWNAAVAGSVSGEEVHLALAAMPGNVIVSTYLSGIAEGDSMRGAYVRSDSSGSAAKGELDATRISPETSTYTPAAIEAASEPAVPEQPQTSVEQPAVQTKKSPYRDVKNLAKGIDPNILPSMAPL